MSNPCFSICPRVCLLGDSTTVYHYYYIPSHHYCRINNQTQSGDTIDNGKTKWLALSEAVRGSFDYIFVQLGLNNLANAEIVTWYQDLITTIKLTSGSTCRVYGVCMTPVRAGTTEERYGRWLALNAAIRGEGATPITGLYGAVSSHLAIMGDANNNLLALYDSGDHFHPNAAGNAVNAEEISKVMV